VRELRKEPYRMYLPGSGPRTAKAEVRGCQGSDGKRNRVAKEAEKAGGRG
jgi:hypothetical protein